MSPPGKTSRKELGFGGRWDVELDQTLRSNDKDKTFSKGINSLLVEESASWGLEERVCSFGKRFKSEG